MYYTSQKLLRSTFVLHQFKEETTYDRMALIYRDRDIPQEHTAELFLKKAVPHHIPQRKEIYLFADQES